jgi:non-ribosomal peptide synthetase component F
VIAVPASGSAFSERLRDARNSVRTLRTARMIVGLRLDKYLRMVAAARNDGIALSARRCPDRPALIDELGMLTYREVDLRANAFAVALQQLPAGAPQMVAVMCRNHRGFVDAVAAADRIGADLLLLNTSFAGPALGDVVVREQPDVIVYDREFRAAVEHALAKQPETLGIAAWTEDPADSVLTVETLIARHAGQRPARRDRKGKVVLLTSGTIGTPKGARRAPGGGGVPRGQIGQIFARTGTEFDGYTSGQAKMVQDGFMASGTWVTSTPRAACSWWAVTTR